MAAKRKPGASIPDAERHTVKRTLRLTPDESAVLDAVAEARGVNVSRAVGALALEACAPRKRGGPTWAQFAAWCSPAENVAIDIAAAESRMIEAHRRARDLSDMEDNALDQRLRSRLGMAMTRAYAETSRLGEEWLALVEARDAKGGGA